MKVPNKRWPILVVFLVSLPQRQLRLLATGQCWLIATCHLVAAEERGCGQEHCPGEREPFREAWEWGLGCQSSGPAAQDYSHLSFFSQKSPIAKSPHEPKWLGGDLRERGSMGQSDQPAGRNKVLAISSECHIGKYQNLTSKKK